MQKGLGKAQTLKSVDVLVSVQIERTLENKFLTKK
jgi:hypothetical protein